MHAANPQSVDRSSGIPASLADRPGTRFTSQTRADWPEGRERPHPRAVALADKIREIAGNEGGASENELRREGFSLGEIVEHLPAAKLILAESFVRELSPAGDRLADVIAKAVASAAHNMPKMSGVDVVEAGCREWRLYCQARAAFKLDPWVSQGERCLQILARFLNVLPMLERERNRVLAAVAAEQKADRMRASQ